MTQGKELVINKLELDKISLKYQWEANQVTDGYHQKDQGGENRWRGG